MFSKVRKAWGEDRRGAVIVLVAVTGTLMAGFAALTIDLGNMYIVRTELQRSADAAALAAVSRLAKYQAGTSETAACNEAKRIVEANPVEAKKITIDTAKDVVFGHGVWNESQKRYNFVAGGGVPTAVRVNVRKTADSPNGPMNLLFANIWGKANKNMWAQAAAMVVPRDISVVVDLSGSMSYDSQLKNYKETSINLWNIWVCLPIEKGNNGVGNGIDPPPPGNPPLNDGYGTGPGNPGNRGGADPRVDPGLMGPTWGRMNTWGTLEITTSYDPANDPGLAYLPPTSNWTGSDYSTVNTWLTQVGYTQQERNALTSKNNEDYWKYRVAVALGLARWDSGKSGGLWSTLPKGKTKNTRGDGDDRVESNELAWLVDFPYKDGSHSKDMEYWLDYINDYMTSTSTFMYDANSNFRYRFGLKTFVNYLLERWRTHEQCPDLAKTPEQPVQATKDAVNYCMDLLTELESDDQVSFEIYATTAKHERNLSKSYSPIADRVAEMQAAHYDNYTNIGGGIDKAIAELTGSRGRANAAKVMFLMTDGNPNVTQGGAVGNESGGRSWTLTKAQEAVNKGIQIYCISVGVEANRGLMQEIAEMSKGEEFFASGTIDQYSAQLKEIFGELGSKRPVRLIE